MAAHLKFLLIALLSWLLIGCAHAARFDQSLMLDLSSETHLSGTLAELTDARTGETIATIGFPEIYNTAYQISGPNLLMLTDPDLENVTVRPVGKPDETLHTYLVRLGDDVLSLGLEARDSHVYNSRRKSWQAIDRLNTQKMAAEYLGRPASDFAGCKGMLDASDFTVRMRRCVFTPDHMVRLHEDNPAYPGGSLMAIPVFSDGRIVIIIDYSMTHEIKACLLADMKQCRTASMIPGEFSYAIDAAGEDYIVHTNLGRTFTLTETGWDVRDLRAINNRSIQVYSALTTEAGAVLGEYPSGRVMRLTDDGLEESEFRFPPHYTQLNAPEAQTLFPMLNGVIAGVWPHGSLYFLRRDGAPYAMRLFPENANDWGLKDEAMPPPIVPPSFLSKPVDIPSTDAPNQAEPYYETLAAAGVANSNALGQRILSIMPIDGALLVSTGSKHWSNTSTQIAALEPVVGDDVLDNYGQVYELRVPGIDTRYLNKLGSSAEFRVRVTEDMIRLSVNGRTIFKSPFMLPLENTIEIRFGDGGLGPLQGGHITAHPVLSEQVPQERAD